MLQLEIEEIIKLLPKDSKLSILDYDNFFVNDISNISDAKKDSLTFLDKNYLDKQKAAETTKSLVIICDNTVINNDKLKGKLLIQVTDPKLVFSKIVNKLLKSKTDFRGVDSTAVIDSSAIIHKSSYVGPNVQIGPNVSIGRNSIIHGNCCLYRNIKIGNNVIINGCTVLGSDGFGYNRDRKGLPIQFPHLGRIIIKDNVEIGSNSSIDLGALGDTVIEKNSKIDNLVHIGHNVRIGKSVLIAAGTVIGGSTIIENNINIWLGVRIKDGIKIDNNAEVGMGSVVINNIGKGKKVFGNPARAYK